MGTGTVGRVTGGHSTLGLPYRSGQFCGLLVPSCGPPPAAPHHTSSGLAPLLADISTSVSGYTHSSQRINLSALVAGLEVVPSAFNVPLALFPLYLKTSYVMHLLQRVHISAQRALVTTAFVAPEPEASYDSW